MSRTKTESTLRLYAGLMEELKQRSMLLELLTENRLSLPEVPNFELCQLQIRNICEILSLACLTAHDDIQEVKSAALQKEYNAERIFGRLEQLHQDFYPVPHTKELIETSASAKPRHFHLTPRVGGFMKKDDLVRSYNECGQYLHRGSIRRLLTKWYPDIDFQKIRTWNAMIRNLLAPYHYIRLAGGQKVMLCVMNNIDEDNAVQCVLAEVSGEVPSGVSI